MGRYTGTDDYQHGTYHGSGILLTNLGTPDSPTTAAVRRYLAEFLSDPRVVEAPRAFWLPVLYGLILLTRPRRSAHAYEKIWTEEGSPLLVNSLKQLHAIRESLDGCNVQIELAMRYGTPSIKRGLDKLRKANVKRILVLPLYPQYSGSTTGSTFDAVSKVLKTWRWIPELRMVNHYHDDSGYISAIVASIRDHWAVYGKPQKLLFSFHGLPEDYLHNGDPYHCQCHKTARLVAEAMELQDQSWKVSFQSRFGPRQWLQPYTDKTLEAWGRQGTESVDVICPGFAADCLETLEEIAIQNLEIFQSAGGGRFNYIPALNDNPVHIQALTDLIRKHCSGWPEFAPARNITDVELELNKTRQIYEAFKS